MFIWGIFYDQFHYNFFHSHKKTENYKQCLLLQNYKINYYFSRLNVPVHDPRIRRPAAQTVVEAAHVIKHTLPS